MTRKNRYFPPEVYATMHNVVNSFPAESAAVTIVSERETQTNRTQKPYDLIYENAKILRDAGHKNRLIGKLSKKLLPDSVQDGMTRDLRVMLLANAILRNGYNTNTAEALQPRKESHCNPKRKLDRYRKYDRNGKGRYGMRMSPPTTVHAR